MCVQYTIHVCIAVAVLHCAWAVQCQSLPVQCGHALRLAARQPQAGMHCGMISCQPESDGGDSDSDSESMLRDYVSVAPLPHFHPRAPLAPPPPSPPVAPVTPVTSPLVLTGSWPTTSHMSRVPLALAAATLLYLCARDGLLSSSSAASSSSASSSSASGAAPPAPQPPAPRSSSGVKITLLDPASQEETPLPLLGSSPLSSSSSPSLRFSFCSS
jgi:hypothetical protein